MTGKTIKNSILSLALLLGLSYQVRGEEPVHPCLIIPAGIVPELKSASEDNPIWNSSVMRYLEGADEILSQEIDVPVPVDPAGGYTHTRHKLNGKAIKQTGVAWLLTGDEKYARHARNFLLEYAEKYPDFGQHPVKKSYAPGILFWQQLNEGVWLTNAIQGYDAIYSFLSTKDRELIESKLLRPYADFLSIENPHVFNRMHNHGVWAAAAVGMTGIVIGDEKLVERALYGTDGEAGFMKQTLTLFSPDGYYTEGPYYQRYAMTPFLLFAQSLENNMPELKIMELGDGIYTLAVRTLVDLSGSNGRYFPINDILKDMSLYAPESVAALCFLYANTGEPEFLDLLDGVVLENIDANSLEVAKALNRGEGEKLQKKSRFIRDGQQGDQGGIALIRDDESEFCTIFKYASHGLSHGHFDRLNLTLINKDREVLTDYGSVRFVNVKAKEGGRYLPENNSYAKQSIAHNTLVLDETSHFSANYEDAQATHASLVYGNLENPALQVVCAREENAYPGVKMIRVVGSLKDPAFTTPLLIDLFKVSSEKEHATFDMPFHFLGNILHTGFEYEPHTTMQQALGKTSGYQYLWKTAEGKPTGKQASLSWLDREVIYTLHTVTGPGSKIMLANTGAGDPSFNLRTEPAIILREENKKAHLFATVLEGHGQQNHLTEIVTGQEPAIKEIKVLASTADYAAIEFRTAEEGFVFITVLSSGQENKEHTLDLEGKSYQWNGNYTLIKHTNHEESK